MHWRSKSDMRLRLKHSNMFMLPLMFFSMKSHNEKNIGIWQVMRLLRSQLSSTATYVIHHHLTMFGRTSAVNCDTNLPQLVGWIHHQLIFLIPNFWKELKFKFSNEVPLRNDRWCFTDCSRKGTLVLQKHFTFKLVLMHKYFTSNSGMKGWIIHPRLLLWFHFLDDWF